jgi:hypothetical protein
MASTNNTAGEALWTRGYPTGDHHIRLFPSFVAVYWYLIYMLGVYIKWYYLLILRICELRRILLSCLGPFGFLLPKIFPLFGFPFGWLLLLLLFVRLHTWISVSATNLVVSCRVSTGICSACRKLDPVPSSLITGFVTRVVSIVK